jgi:hypothetical protein
MDSLENYPKLNGFFKLSWGKDYIRCDDDII